MGRRFYGFNNRFRTTNLFGYLNPYYRAAYSIPKRKR